MASAPHEPSALDEADRAELDEPIVAELNDDLNGTELATIPFCLPAPPQPGVALVLIAGLVIVVYGFAAGYCVATIMVASHGHVVVFSVIGFFFAATVAWAQVLGAFRPHEQRANAAGNFLIGTAAMVAVALAGIPMVAAEPILLNQLLGFGGMTVFLSIAGYLNLAWSRRLQSAGWKSPGDWTFSLRELLAITTAVAVGFGGYMFCQRLHAERTLLKRQEEEVWRQLRMGNSVRSKRSAVSPSGSGMGDE
jgi:hypothetical protein